MAWWYPEPQARLMKVIPFPSLGWLYFQRRLSPDHIVPWLRGRRGYAASFLGYAACLRSSLTPRSSGQQRPQSAPRWRDGGPDALVHDSFAVAAGSCLRRSIDSLWGRRCSAPKRDIWGKSEGCEGTLPTSLYVGWEGSYSTASGQR